MEEVFIQDKTLNFGEPVPKGEYENCKLIGCDLSGVDLSGVIFTDCVFTACNLSMARMQQTAFRSVLFTECKLLGLQFEAVNPYGLSLSFENCRLNQSSFNKLKIREVKFLSCELTDVDFTESDLGKAVFRNCNLTAAMFDHTNLEKADFSGSLNFDIDPEINSIKGATFSLAALPRLLSKYEIKVEY